MKKMKKLKKLSLENEMKKEAEQIEKKVREDRSLDDIKVSDEMEKELFNKIQDYEYDKRHKKVVRKKKKSKLVIGALAAVLILVMAVGMTSIGGPERMLQFMKSSVGGRKVSQVDSSDKNKVIEEEDEEKAYEKIGEEFGIEPVRIIWHPEEMKFEKMLMDTDIQLAELDYLYNGEKTTFMISASYGETSWGYDEEDEIVKQYSYDKIRGIKIEITEYLTPETETNRYVAEFEFKKLHYYLSGTMNQSELEKILEKLYFM